MAKKKDTKTIEPPVEGIIDNKQKKQFELWMDGHLARVPYNFKDDAIALFHTEVPDELRGRGLAKQLTLYALNYAMENHLKIIPYCPFIAKYIRDHQQWQSYVKS